MQFVRIGSRSAGASDVKGTHTLPSVYPNTDVVLVSRRTLGSGLQVGMIDESDSGALFGPSRNASSAMEGRMSERQPEGRFLGTTLV